LTRGEAVHYKRLANRQKLENVVSFEMTGCCRIVALSVKTLPGAY